MADTCKAQGTAITDVNGVVPSNIARRKNRILFMLALAQNPRHFYYCGMGVTVEFAKDGAALQDRLTGFLLRQKCGL